MTGQGWTVGRAVLVAGINRESAHKLLTRHRTALEPGLAGRHSRLRRMPGLTRAAWRLRFLELRQIRLTGAHIAT